MPVHDYTTLPLGVAIDGGTVKTCPHCLKVGLAQCVNGKVFHTHHQLMRWDERGHAVVIWEMCPRVPVRQVELRSQ